ncbi:MAG: primosomal protein N', partial [Bacteroidetes bacterium]
MTETYFVDVIVPVPVEGVFSYRVPEKLNEQIAVGKRVLVQFGRRKLYAGIIAGIHQNPPKDYQAKYVEEVLDDYPVVTPSQLQLWKWISEYYMTPVGQVMNVALPLGLKISSETKYVLNPYQNIDENVLSDEEFLVVEALHHQPELSPAEISQITGKNNVMTLVNKLLKDRVIIAKEEVKTLFKPKLETFVKFSLAISDEQTFNTAFEQIGRAAAQQRGILTLAFLTKNDFTKAIPKKEWMEKAKISSSVVNELIKKGYIELYEEEVSRLSFGHDQQPVNPLDKYQSEKLTEIKTQFEKQKVVLLHGVTSSGKTEIYIHLILEELKKGKQVLYLLPEIALTTQIIERLKNIFGEQLGVYHSKFSVHERVEVWQGVLQRKLNLIIGARSSVFLPFQDLGLIIVDEEHDGSFKQMEPSPRYNARDTAVVLAGYFRANVLLGTATPSVESYFNAEKGKYALVEMKKRYGNIQLPEILVADLKNDYKKRKTKGHFSELLYEKIKEALHNNEQVILFQNRRGFSPYIQCNTCDWIATCKNCAVNLTYHKRFHELKCHYCGYTTEMPEKCGKCGSTDIQLRGLGTEKVEEEISEIFPNASVKRMDADTTRSKNAYLSIIKDFENRKIDILIGTQMITKGLDFDNVSVVGIM